MINNNEVPSTIEEIFQWKNGPRRKEWPKSVESYNSHYTQQCGGDSTTDVLFSFLGIYTIGVWAFNNEKKALFKIDANKIRVKVNDNYKQILCSKTFLSNLQEAQNSDINVSEVNECLKEFVALYFSVGNLIPIWPGGNKEKGNQNKGYMDIPELFFVRHQYWYDSLLKIDNSYLDEFNEYIKNNERSFDSLKNFLDSVNTKEKYKEYINHVVFVIQERTKKIINQQNNGE